MAWYKMVIIILVCCVIGALLAFLSFFQNTGLEQGNFSLHNQEIHLEIAKTPVEHYQGLSDRQTLCNQCGMLFVFKSAESKTFVMRRMKFPLDIVWINQGTVVGISKNLSPESAKPYTPYPSPGVVDQVLELNAGQADVYNLEVGKKINFLPVQ